MLFCNLFKFYPYTIIQGTAENLFKKSRQELNFNIMNLSTSQKREIKRLLNKFKNLKSTSFISVKEYQSSTSGEIADHNILVNFDYGNAVKKDLNKLNNATVTDINKIATAGEFKKDLVLFAINKLKTSFEKNLNKETKSKGSNAQNDAYYPITKAVRLHLESGKLFIYGMTQSKKVIVKGTYKPVNSRELTLCQNKIKKYFNFSTAKFRQYAINPVQIDAVKLAGDIFEI